MTDAPTVEERVEALERRVLELEAQLAIQRGMQGNARWSGDSGPMTIEHEASR